MIYDWFAQLDVNSLLFGLLAGLVIAILSAWIAARRSARRHLELWQPRVEQLENDLAESGQALNGAHRDLAIVQTRLEEQQGHFQKERASLEQAEKRLAESFERLAGKVFDERSKSFTELSEKQLGAILKPLTKDLDSFRGKVEESHKEDIKQHAALQERLRQLETLNEQLNEEARNLSRALTQDVKAQGNWGEQQLERLLEISGLQKGHEYSTQYSVTTEGGQRVQPDLVLHLPEGKSIVLDSKVSLLAWTRYQAAADDEARAAALKEHILSLRQHVKNLGEKRYAEIPELNSLDFVLMFVPIESALIAALQTDPELAEFALRNKVALLSPTNFLATMRTVGSVWAVHKQNRNAQEIAGRAGLLYDKFAGFVDNLRQVGDRLRQAQQSYDSAFSQLSTGAGNLLRQADQLRELGARNTKQIDRELLEQEAEQKPPQQ